VSLLLFFYVIGFVPALLNNVYTAVLYGFGKMRTALFICVAMLSTNIVLSLVLSRFIGLAGIAVGTTAANLLIVFFYRRAAAKCVEGYRFALDLGYVWKCALGLAACGALLVPIKLFVHSAFLAFPLAAAGGFAAFFAVLYLTRETVFMGYFEKLARMWKRKKNA
jgi:putative peptidoglycan lipid II flippase